MGLGLKSCGDSFFFVLCARLAQAIDNVLCRHMIQDRDSHALSDSFSCAFELVFMSPFEGPVLTSLVNDPDVQNKVNPNHCS